MMATNPNDLFGILERDALANLEGHFDVGDGWEIILIGEEIRRSKELKRVAITRAEITFDSEENVQRFLEVIKESDARLSQLSDEEAMYDWQIVRGKGLTVRFGVAWYNKEFYQEKKDAYRSASHASIFSVFDVSPDSLRIEHIPF